MENRNGKTVCWRCGSENVNKETEEKGNIKSITVTCLNEDCKHIDNVIPIQ